MSSFISAIGKPHQKKTSPEQLVRAAQRALGDFLDAPSGEKTSALSEELCRRLSQVKIVLYGGANDGDKLDVDEEKAEEISQRIQEEGLLLQLIDKLVLIPFEARKDTAQIFNNLMHKNISNFVTYISDHFYVVKQIAHGYESTEIALNCGTMLRECIRYEDLIRQILQPQDTFLWKFFDEYVHLPNFDVASDAFNTLRDILVSVRNKEIASDFLEQRYDDVFAKYEILLESGNYVTRRRSLKLLGELLLDRSNFNVMIRFISAEHNLQVVMNLLRDKSANIQFEAFHVFKVFVANPNKPAMIRLILFKNKQKLCNYLTNFHQDKEDEDSQFSEEKKLLIATLDSLEKPSGEEIRKDLQRNAKHTPRSTSVEHSGEDHQPAKKEKGCLREALAAADSAHSNVNAVNVILDESDNQPNALPTPLAHADSSWEGKNIEDTTLDESSRARVS